MTKLERILQLHEEICAALNKKVGDERRAEKDSEYSQGQLYEANYLLDKTKEIIFSE